MFSCLVSFDTIHPEVCFMEQFRRQSLRSTSCAVYTYPSEKLYQGMHYIFQRLTQNGPSKVVKFYWILSIFSAPAPALAPALLTAVRRSLPTVKQIIYARCTFTPGYLLCPKIGPSIMGFWYPRVLPPHGPIDRLIGPVTTNDGGATVMQSGDNDYNFVESFEPQNLH